MKKGLKAIGLALTIFVLTLCVKVNSYAWTERYVDFANGVDGGANDGTSEALAWKTLQYALDTATSGMRINVEYDDATYTQTLAASIDVDTNAGSSDSPIVVQGYSATVGDGTKAVIDGNSAAVNNFLCAKAYIVFMDLQLKGATADAITFTTAGDNNYFYNVEILTAGSDGFGGLSGAVLAIVINCEINNTGTAGASAGIDMNVSGIFAYYNYIHDITGIGIDLSDVGNAIVFKNIIDTTSAQGILQGGDNQMILENTIYNSVGSNLEDTGATHEAGVVINNIFDTSGDYNIELVAGANIFFYGYNCLEHETTGTLTGTVLFNIGGDQSNVDPQFTDAPNKDFNIGANLDDDGFPTAWNGAPSTTGNQEIGAIPYEETGGTVSGSSTHGYGHSY